MLIQYQCFAIEYKREEIVMRSIGHEIMLRAGDSTTFLMPVTKNGNQYRIDFSAEFSFEATELAHIVDSIMRSSNLATEYRVSVVPCQGSDLLYGYEITVENSLVPCTGRVYPNACYSLLITLLNTEKQPDGQTASMVDFKWLILLIIIGAITFFLLLRIKPKPENSTSNFENFHASIGQFTFDQQNLILKLGDKITVLTGKECDLLALLLQNQNETVDREKILNVVWGDDGDYVGRTLDVFISKLRKKLEADRNVRIISIRGVGYKLILNGNHE